MSEITVFPARTIVTMDPSQPEVCPRCAGALALIGAGGARA